MNLSNVRGRFCQKYQAWENRCTRATSITSSANQNARKANTIFGLWRRLRESLICPSTSRDSGVGYYQRQLSGALQWGRVTWNTWRKHVAKIDHFFETPLQHRHSWTTLRHNNWACGMFKETCNCNFFWHTRERHSIWKQPKHNTTQHRHNTLLKP